MYNAADAHREADAKHGDSNPPVQLEITGDAMSVASKQYNHQEPITLCNCLNQNALQDSGGESGIRTQTLFQVLENKETRPYLE
jgi:hypothetical protein